MSNDHLCQAALEHILILPRRLWLETPEVMATVPMLRGCWGAALLDHTAVYRDVFGDDNRPNPPGYFQRPAPPDPRPAPAVDSFSSPARAQAHESQCFVAATRLPTAQRICLHPPSAPV